MKNPDTRLRRQQRRLMMVGITSSTIEYYDFLLYGTMSAIVFNQLFFPQVSSAAGTLAAFATFGVGFLARPFGSVILGRLGDRIGRKPTLQLSLLAMGFATVGVGLMPTYETIGILAPLLLVALRFIQGFALGGEWAGASLLLVESAPDHRRNFMASVVQMGALGLVLSTLVTTVTSHLTGDSFATWGWRIPFLVSTVLFVFTYWLRSGVHESSVFETALDRLEQEPQQRRPGLGYTVRYHWQPIVLGFFVTGAGVIVYYTITTFGIAYAISNQGMDRTAVLNALTLASVVYLIAIPVAGWAADKTSARTVLLVGLIFGVALAFPFFVLLDQGRIGVFTGIALYLSLSHALIQAPQGAVYAQHFPPLVRYTGTALCQALPAAIVGGVTPALAQALLNATGSNHAITVLIFLFCALGAGAAYLLTRHEIPITGEVNLASEVKPSV